MSEPLDDVAGAASEVDPSAARAPRSWKSIAGRVAAPFARIGGALIHPIAHRIPTLDRYVLRRFFGIYFANLISFSLLYVVIDLVNNIDNFYDSTDGFGELAAACFGYYYSMVPVIYCQILGPVVCVAAALFTVTLFQRSNEFVPILATGRSYQRALFAIVVASAGLSVVVFLVQEIWIPFTVEQIHASMQKRGERATFRDLKYHDSERGMLIILRQYDRFERRAEGVLVLPVGSRGGTQRHIDARSMQWQEPEGRDPYWRMRDARIQEYDSEGTLVIRNDDDWEGVPRLDELLPYYELETTMAPEDLELGQEEAVYMTMSALRKRVEDAQDDQSRWVVKYMARFSTPLVNLILVLLGLPIVVLFGNRNVFVGALLAVGVSAVYFFFHSIFQEFGVRGHVPARFGAWVGPALFLALGATLYREMRS